MNFFLQYIFDYVLLSDKSDYFLSLLFFTFINCHCFGNQDHLELILFELTKDQMKVLGVIESVEVMSHKDSLQVLKSGQVVVNVR